MSEARFRKPSEISHLIFDSDVGFEEDRTSTRSFDLPNRLMSPGLLQVGHDDRGTVARKSASDRSSTPIATRASDDDGFDTTLHVDRSLRARRHEDLGKIGHNRQNSTGSVTQRSFPGEFPEKHRCLRFRLR